MAFPRPVFLSFAVTLLALAAQPQAARASVIAFDDFSNQWPGSAPIESNAGFGWDGPWRIGPNVTATVDKTEKGSRFVTVSGGDTIRAMMRRIAAPASIAGKPLYARITFSVDAPDHQLGESFVGWYFLDAQGHRMTNNAIVFNYRGSIGARVNEQTATVPGKIEAGRTYVAVVKIDGWDNNRKHYTSTTVWLDPDRKTSERGQLNQASISGEGCGPVTELSLRTNKLGDSAWRFTNIKLCTTWDDAVAAPSSSSL